jgi:hypothetical protein
MTGFRQKQARKFTEEYQSGTGTTQKQVMPTAN